ncbi:oxygen-independent coproporphyrinogen III oxidase [Salegentibacter salegens]|uniref:Coproporphyrinogen-III oxidase n=1 Tax=Salegentibacter salegens TaxID=143223 RepID=A0A1M7LDB3_9FLAO|nr:oxygen-independent coproporphyrinogen III oxidase [Salegentibacter salegens]PRX50601.1 oxygen-independent coproporphyrinogen-3 oxidase [Salegentibacter salegens]SHM75596.1 oxygen-independent coproporphyrinogen-3 oxidase [Salegentibacter salegens]
MSSNLITKYNVPGPRYTSYPTVPYWDDKTFSSGAWENSLIRSFKENKEISLYIHLPFCESLCTFCGCNKRITKKHSVETPYIESVLREWDLYLEMLGDKPIIREVHLGGGTPTFFAPENLKFLLKMLFRKADRDCETELSFEGHPNNTTKEHLKVLAELGFRRVSYGVQDYSEKVQKAIHRIQPFQNVKDATDHAREAGFTSVGHDIIFGLPFQTKEDIIDTIEKTKQLMPDRIAFYSYAHVPWIKGNGQRGFKDSDLPGGDEKREMYETGKQMLEDAGYVEIGMDHFALKSDTLYKAVEEKKLHRNFMGYTTSSGTSMIGLGVSAISDSWYGFAQNEKSVEAYQELIAEGIIPVFRGHILNEEDLVIRKHILNLMCRLETNWAAPEDYFEELPEVLIKLREMEADGLVTFSKNGLTIPEKGRAFIRNICMAFDLRMQAQKPNTQLFSMTV